MKSIRLFALSGRWDFDPLADLFCPSAEMADTGNGADDSNPDLLRFSRLPMRSIEEETVLRMRRHLPKSKLKGRLVQIYDRQCPFPELHHDSSSGSGRPRVLMSSSS